MKKALLFVCLFKRKEKKRKVFLILFVCFFAHFFFFFCPALYSKKMKMNRKKEKGKNDVIKTEKTQKNIWEFII